MFPVAADGGRRQLPGALESNGQSFASVVTVTERDDLPVPHSEHRVGAITWVRTVMSVDPRYSNGHHHTVGSPLDFLELRREAELVPVLQSALELVPPIADLRAGASVAGIKIGPFQLFIDERTAWFEGRPERAPRRRRGSHPRSGWTIVISSRVAPF